MIDQLVRTYLDEEQKAKSLLKDNELFQGEWSVDVTIRDIEAPGTEWTIVMRGRENIYAANSQAHLVNGSYSITDKDFKGFIASPAIDTVSEHPGKDWSLLQHGIPKSLLSVSIYFAVSDIDVRKVLVHKFGDMPIA